jgi:hypothetical protein
MVASVRRSTPNSGRLSRSWSLSCRGRPAGVLGVPRPPGDRDDVPRRYPPATLYRSSVREGWASPRPRPGLAQASPGPAGGLHGKGQWRLPPCQPCDNWGMLAGTEDRAADTVWGQQYPRQAGDTGPEEAGIVKLNRSPIRLLAIGILIAGGVVSSATPSDAATPYYDPVHARTLVLRVIDSADPARTYGSLSLTEKGEFQWAQTPAPSPQLAASSRSAAPTLLAAASGCWIATAGITYYSVVGLAIYRMSQTDRWCGSNGTITSFSLVSRWVDNVSFVGPLWRGRVLLTITLAGSGVIGSRFK